MQKYGRKRSNKKKHTHKPERVGCSNQCNKPSTNSGADNPTCTKQPLMNAIETMDIEVSVLGDGLNHRLSCSVPQRIKNSAEQRTYQDSNGSEIACQRKQRKR